MDTTVQEEIEAHLNTQRLIGWALLLGLLFYVIIVCDHRLRGCSLES